MDITVRIVQPRELVEPQRSTGYFLKRGLTLVAEAQSEDYPDIKPLALTPISCSFQLTGMGRYEATFQDNLTLVRREIPLYGQTERPVLIRESHWALPKKVSGLGPPDALGVHLFLDRYCNGRIEATVQISNGSLTKEGTGFCGEAAVERFVISAGPRSVMHFVEPTYIGARGIYAFRWTVADGEGQVRHQIPREYEKYGPGDCTVLDMTTPPPEWHNEFSPYGEENGAAPGGWNLYPVNAAGLWQEPRDYFFGKAAGTILRQRLACYEKRTGDRITFNQELRLTRGAKPSKITELGPFVYAQSPYDDVRIYHDLNSASAVVNVGLKNYAPHDGQHLIRAFTWLEPLIMGWGDLWAIHTMQSLAMEAYTSWHPEYRRPKYGWTQFTLGNLIDSVHPLGGSPMAGREYGWVATLAAWNLALTRQADDTDYRKALQWANKLLAFGSKAMMMSGIPLMVTKDQAQGGQTSFWDTYGVPDDVAVAQTLELPIVWWGMHCLMAQLGITTARPYISRGVVEVYCETPYNPDDWSGKMRGPPKCLGVSTDSPNVLGFWGPGEPINGHWILPVVIQWGKEQPEYRVHERRLMKAIRQLGHPAKSAANKLDIFQNGNLNDHYLAASLLKGAVT